MPFIIFHTILQLLWNTLFNAGHQLASRMDHGSTFVIEMPDLCCIQYAPNSCTLNTSDGTQIPLAKNAVFTIEIKVLILLILYLSLEAIAEHDLLYYLITTNAFAAIKHYV